MTKTIRRIGCLLIAALCLLSACSSGESEERDKDLTLTIMDTDEQQFNSQFLPLLKAQYPKWTFRVLSYGQLLQGQETGAGEEERLRRAFDELQPDVVVIRNSTLYRQMADGNFLKSIDPQIKENKLLENPLDSSLLDRMTGTDGNIYGLASFFSRDVVYYNAALFQTYGLTVPHDGMTWKELFNIASLVPASDEYGNPLYGFSHPMADRPFDVIQQASGSLDQAIHSPDQQEMWSLITDAYRDKHVYRPGTQGEGQTALNAFMEGQLAMLYGSDAELGQLGAVSFPLGIATEPVRAEQPGVGPSFRYREYTAISSQTDAPEAAWEVIHFLNSASSVEKDVNGGIPLSASAARNRFAGTDLSPFYKLQPPSLVSDNKAESIEPDLIVKLIHEGNKEALSIIAEQTTVEEALKRLSAIH